MTALWAAPLQTGRPSAPASAARVASNTREMTVRVMTAPSRSPRRPRAATGSAGEQPVELESEMNGEALIGIVDV